MTYDLLDNCEVIAATEKAIKVAWTDKEGDIQNAWIPRSVCQNGDELGEGDQDISVARWFASKEDLPV
jgi:hypothetical protein